VADVPRVHGGKETEFWLSWLDGNRRSYRNARIHLMRPIKITTAPIPRPCSLGGNDVGREGAGSPPSGLKSCAPRPLRLRISRWWSRTGRDLPGFIGARCPRAAPHHPCREGPASFDTRSK
jgi:hypothetical protein